MGECINYQTKELTRELASWGYGLGEYGHSVEHPKPIKPIEELIMEILTKNPDPRYILGIPVIIAKNKVDYEKLLALAEKNDALRRVGYLLDVTQNISKDRILLLNIETFIQKAYDSLNDSMPEESLYPDSEETKRNLMNIYLDKNNSVAIKWKVFTLNEVDDIKDVFQLYTEGPRDSSEQILAFMRKKYSKRGVDCGESIKIY